jgi:hypothetical protein
MGKVNFGYLEKVDLRTAWKNEAHDFTPWLASEDNIKLLGESVDIDLEFVAQEKEVGPYRADILCKDLSDDSLVLIENQLEKSDHTHFGQILTYAAGLNTVTIIWITSRFTDEHRAALEWMNEITGDDIKFFGLEVELWKIGDSKVAPKFNVAVKPNDWTKGKVSDGSRGLSASRIALRDFWVGFTEYAESHAVHFKPGKPRPDNYMSISIGRSGFRLEGVAAIKYLRPDTGGQGLRVQLTLAGADDLLNFHALLEMRDSIEAQLGSALVWVEREGSRKCRIILYRDTDISDSKYYEDAYSWLVEHLDRFYKIFSPLIVSM